MAPIVEAPAVTAIASLVSAGGSVSRSGSCGPRYAGRWLRPHLNGGQSIQPRLTSSIFTISTRKPQIALICDQTLGFSSARWRM